jgi:multidrug resistance protein MdtO
MLGTLVAMAVAWVSLRLGHTEDAPAVRSRAPLLVPDAFSNPDHRRFALKGCLAGLLCYVLDSSVTWPVIMGSCAETCIVAARPLSAGAGTRNERLFVSVTALILGGVVLGFGLHGLLLPFVDSITGFILQFAVIAALAAWVATSSPRLSYAGTLGAMGFFFPMVQRFAPNPPLARSGAFMLDLVLALLAFWLVLDGASNRQASPEAKQFA